MKKRNKHLGSSFDDFLKEEGIVKEVTARARKRVAAMRGADRTLYTPAMTKSIKAGMKEPLTKSSRKLSW